MPDESRGQFAQVHQTGQGRDRGRPEERHAALPRVRYRDGHRTGQDRQPLHRVQADRRHDRLRVRRHGPRPLHHQEVHRDARRPHLGGKRDRQGLELHLRNSTEGASMSGKTILYVEDNEMNRKIVRQLLKKTTYNLVEAHDGESGVAKALEIKPDLVLMDVQLPKLSGIDATRQLRAALDPAATLVLVITWVVLPG